MLKIFLILFVFPLWSGSSICLNMIVKNESSIIEKCLESVKGVIDHWVIVDTGSTDGTQEIIRKYLANIPGELHERPWVDFSHNRNEALQLAKGKGDYLLFIDADEVLEFTKPFVKENLTKDCYFVVVHQTSGQEVVDYQRITLVNNRLPWKWEGVLHEVIGSSQAQTAETLSGVVNISDTTKGHRFQDPEKYLKDALVLEKALKKEPGNARYQFYLGQSYASAKEYTLALKAFEKRAVMGGYEEEVFCSKYNIAKLQQILKMEPEVFLKSYRDAHAYRPVRAEPYYCIACYYIDIKDYEKAYAALKSVRFVLDPNEKLFVERWVYEWGHLFKLAQCCLGLGKMDEMRIAMKKMLAVSSLPEKVRAVISQ